jgi:hypothetical protein
MRQNRAFKTARFSKDSKKAKIKDVELCLAIQQVLLGQVDDLGGRCFSRRGSTATCTGQSFWLKVASIGSTSTCSPRRDRANIENDELLAFRLLANSYAGLTETAG